VAAAGSAKSAAATMARDRKKIMGNGRITCKALIRVETMPRILA
jgi:hypothetical protein